MKSKLQRALLIGLLCIGSALAGEKTAYACQNLYGLGTLTQCMDYEFCGFFGDCIIVTCENVDIMCPDTQMNNGQYCSGYNGCPNFGDACLGGRLKCPTQ